MRLAILLMLGAAVWGGVKEDLRAAEDRWAAAMKGSDTATLERVFAPELIYSHSNGVTQTGGELIADLKAGKRHYESFTWESFRVVQHGDAVITHSMLRIGGRNAQGAYSDHLMMMHTWVKQKGEWRLAGHQTAKIP